MFPGINFVLLDSDCLPITLFEVEDLWTEAYLARFPVHSNSGIPRAHPLRAFKRFCNDPKVVDTQQQVGSTRMGQGALVVTEPHAELNAGLIVIFRSSHPPKKYVNIPSGKYIYVHKYVYICVYTYLCKMDEYRHNAGLS